MRNGTFFTYLLYTNFFDYAIFCIVPFLTKHYLVKIIKTICKHKVYNVLNIVK